MPRQKCRGFFCLWGYKKAALRQPFLNNNQTKDYSAFKEAGRLSYGGICNTLYCKINRTINASTQVLTPALHINVIYFDLKAHFGFYKSADPQNLQNVASLSCPSRPQVGQDSGSSFFWRAAIARSWVRMPVGTAIIA